MPKLAYILVLAILTAIFVALAPPPLTFVTLSGFLAMWFLVRNLEFGVLLLIFFFPYLGLVIDFGEFEIFRDTVYLKNINAPFVDLFGLVLFGAWCISVLGNKQPLRSTLYALRSLPHLKPYLLFWLSGLVSLWKVPAIHFGASLKYFARPFTFAYLVFFAMPAAIMSKAHNPPRPPLILRGGELVHRVLLVFFWTGLLSAFNGFLGLLFGAHEAFPRATPFGFFGINPLGPNHNLLAETLIATAPSGLLLSWIYGGRTSDPTEVRPHRIPTWIRYGMVFQWAVALLTFARTAWIAVAVQAILYVWLTQKGRVKTFLRKSVPILLILGVLVIILIGTTFNEAVRGSTLSRFDMARIAAFYFERAPILGQGIGTFLPTLWGTRAYLLEYGDPVEAHGIIFKLMFEQGLFGIVAFGIFAGAILFSLYRAYRTNKTNRTYIIAALMIAAGSLAYQLFNTTYYTSKLWIPLAIAVAIGQLSKSSESSKASA